MCVCWAAIFVAHKRSPFNCRCAAHHGATPRGREGPKPGYPGVRMAVTDPRGDDDSDACARTRNRTRVEVWVRVEMRVWARVWVWGRVWVIWLEIWVKTWAEMRIMIASMKVKVMAMAVARART